MPRRGTGAYVEGLPANAVIGLLFTRATHRCAAPVGPSAPRDFTDASEGPHIPDTFVLLLEETF